MPLNPGLLNEQRLLLRMARTSNGAGGWTEKPIERGRVRCFVRPITPREVVQGSQARATVTHKVYVDGDDLKVNDRLRAADGSEVEVLALERRSGTSGFRVGFGVERTIEPEAA